MKNCVKQMVLKIAVVFVFSFAFFSCETTDSFSCPYLISNSHVELGEKEGAHNFAGMYFSLYNESEKTIDNFTMSFMLYDSDGNNPFVGSNCIVSKCAWCIAGGAVTDFVINLDPHLSVVPDEPYIVDYIYLREIQYTDGSSWKDPYGMYCVQEAYE